jgi:hypothetical protein
MRAPPHGHWDQLNGRDNRNPYGQIFSSLRRRDRVWIGVDQDGDRGKNRDDDGELKRSYASVSRV